MPIYFERNYGNSNLFLLALLENELGFEVLVLRASLKNHAYNDVDDLISDVIYMWPFLQPIFYAYLLREFLQVLKRTSVVPSISLNAYWWGRSFTLNAFALMRDYQKDSFKLANSHFKLTERLHYSFMNDTNEQSLFSEDFELLTYIFTYYK